jgi:hypothetical protein
VEQKSRLRLVLRLKHVVAEVVGELNLVVVCQYLDTVWPVKNFAFNVEVLFEVLTKLGVRPRRFETQLGDCPE